MARALGPESYGALLVRLGARADPAARSRLRAHAVRGPRGRSGARSRRGGAAAPAGCQGRPAGGGARGVGGAHAAAGRRRRAGGGRRGDGARDAARRRVDVRLRLLPGPGGDDLRGAPDGARGGRPRRGWHRARARHRAPVAGRGVGADRGGRTGRGGFPPAGRGRRACAPEAVAVGRGGAMAERRRHGPRDLLRDGVPAGGHRPRRLARERARGRPVRGRLHADARSAGPGLDAVDRADAGLRPHVRRRPCGFPGHLARRRPRAGAGGPADRSDDLDPLGPTRRAVLRRRVRAVRARARGRDLDLPARRTQPAGHRRSAGRGSRGRH